MNRQIVLVTQARLILIFIILCCFSLLGFAGNPYRYTDRYLFQSPTTKNLSNQEHWLATFGLSPNNREIYAIDNTKKLLTIVNVDTGATLKIIPLPIMGHDFVSNVVFSPDGKKAYFDTNLNIVYIIDTTKQAIIGKVANKPEATWIYVATGLYMIPDSHYLYAVDGGAESRDKAPQIHVIDSQVDSVVATIKKDHIHEPGLGWFEATFAFNKKTGMLYFTDMIFSSVSILNTHDHTLEDEAIKYEEGTNITGITINPQNNKLYVLSMGGSLFVTDLLTGKIIDEISSGTTTFDLALAANGTKLYITDRTTDIVSVLDVTQQSKLIKKIPVGNKPQTLRISSDGSKLYVGNAGSNDISVIDVATDKVVRVITINN